MDEEERKRRLQAGKEALLAFQKKKKKSKSKKKSQRGADADVCVHDSSAISEPPTHVEVTDLHAVPADEIQPKSRIAPVLNDGFNESVLQTASSLYQNSALHLDPASLPADQLQQSSIATSFDVDEKFMVEQSDMLDGSAERHNSLIPPGVSISSSTLELEHQLKVASESQQQLQNELKVSQSREIKLQNELNAVHEDQLIALENAKREQASQYESQIAVLQSSLMETERSLQDFEKKISNVTESHASELEQLLQTQENIRQTMLKEQDQKHAEHIARITQEMSVHQDIIGADGAHKDEGELEAERLKMIKEKMKEMHEEEKRQLNEKHKHEVQVVREECQQQLESYRIDTENLVNSKIQEMHGQFMAAHQAVVDQKNTSNIALQEVTMKLNELHQKYDVLVLEKNEVEDQCQSMIVTHSAELERARGDTLSLQQKLSDWKEKAANLESRLQNTHSQTSSELDELRHNSEEELASVKSQYESKLQSLQSTVDSYKSQLQASEETHQLELQETEDKYQSQLDELRGSHAGEVSLLETSVAESTSNKASLELAEQHMNELQKQLEGYRRQEGDLQSRISELQYQHSEEVQIMKQELEAQKVEEVQRTSKGFSLQIEDLKTQLNSLSVQLEAKQLEDGDQDRNHVEVLKSRHQEEITKLRSDLLSSKEQDMEDLSTKLRTTHSEKIAELKTEHSIELDSLKRSLIKEWSSRLDHEKSLLIAELDEVRHSEMSRLDKEHRQAMQKVRDSLSQSGQSLIAKAKQRSNELEAELKALQDEQLVWESTHQELLSRLELAQQQLKESNSDIECTKEELKQVSKDCHDYQNQIQSLKDDANVSNSEHDHDVQILSQEIDGWKRKVDELQTQVLELQTTEASNAHHSKEMVELVDQVAAKNVAIADLQAQNDTLNTEVFSLTQKCQKHIATSESLQKQLENNWGVNEEIETLRQQVAELKRVDESCAALKEKVNSLEMSLAGKTAELERLKEQQLERANEQAQIHQQEAEASAQELEQLRNINSEGSIKQAMLQQQVSDLQSQIRQLTSQNAESEEMIVNLQKAVKNLESELTASRVAHDDMKARDNEELVKKFEQLQHGFDSLRAERDQLLSDINKLKEEHALILDEQNTEWEEKLNEQNEVVRNLETKLKAQEREMQEAMTTQVQLGAVIGEKSELEEGLSQAKHALTDKLHEKSLLEKELSYHRVELERRLKEKQRLEELLFEKSRFEQELQSQRQQLQDELDEIESRLKLKDVEFQEREQELKQEHSNELNHLHHNLREKHLAKVDGMQSRHNTELKELNEELSKTQDKVAYLERKLDEQLHEVTTLNESRQGEMEGLESRVKHEVEEKTALLEQTIQQQYQEILEQKLKAEQERLEKAHQLQMAATISEEHQQADEIQTVYEDQIATLKLDANAREVALRDDHDKEIETMKVHYESRLVEQASCFEEERAENASDFQRMQDKVHSLEEQISNLKTNEQHVYQQHQMIGNEQAKLNELERQYKAQLNAEIMLRKEFEAKVALLQQECQFLQDRLSQSTELEAQAEKKLCTKEAIFSEEIAKMQLEHEQRQREFEVSLFHKVSDLNKEHSQREHDLIAAHEQRCELLASALEDEKKKLVDKYESEISDIELAQSERLLELRAEVIQASKKASERFTEQLMTELESQKEKLEQQHMISLSLQEEKLRAHFSNELQTIKSSYESAHVDAVAKSQSESALRHAVKLEEVRRHLLEEKGKALKEQKISLEAKLREDLVRLKHQDKTGMMHELHRVSVERQNALSAQEAELTAQFEAKLIEVEKNMTNERKTQLTLLKEHYEHECEQYKKQAQIELEQSKHVKELLVESRRERETVLQTFNEKLCLLKEAEGVHANSTEQIESLKAQYEFEIRSIKDQNAAELESKIEEVRKKLIKEHMSKFKEVTDKLQQVHQCELESLKQEKEELESKHLEELELLREELDVNHLQNLSEVTAAHKRELEILYTTNISQLNGEHTQQEGQQWESHEIERESTEDLMRQELSQINQDLEAKLSHLDEEKMDYVEQVTSLTEQLSQAKQELQHANRQFEESKVQMEDIKKQHTENLLHERSHHQDHITELESELRELRGDRQQENGNHQNNKDSALTLSRVHSQLSTVKAERDVLQSTVVALQGALTHSLQLSAVVNSVMGTQKDQQHQNMDTLPENLLVSHASDVTSQTGVESSPHHHTLSTLTGSDSPCSSNSATDSTGLLEGKRTQLSQGASVKLTPSVDSGVASRLTSILPSESDGTLVETPVSSSTGRSITTPSWPMHNWHPDTAIQHLETTDTSPTILTQTEDIATSQVVSPGFSPSHHQHTTTEAGDTQSFLSVSFMSAESEKHTPLDETLQSEAHPDLSIVPLDSTTSQFDALPLEPPLMSPSLSVTCIASMSDLASLQAELSTFHDSVCAMVQKHVTTTAQLSEYQQMLSETQSQLSQLKSQLNAVEQSKTKLQHVLDERCIEEQHKVSQLKLLEAKLSDKTEQLANAESKIEALVQQVEGRSDNLESELVEETEVLIKKFRDHECLETQLKSELVESHTMLAKAEEQITTLRVDNKDLTDEVNRLTGITEAQNRQVEQAQIECQQTKQDCEAMKEVNKELQSQREHQDLKLSLQLEETNQMRAEYEKELLAKQCEIHELEDMKNRLAAKEEIEEKLVCEKEEVVLHLNKVQHQLATLKSGINGSGSVTVLTPETVESMGEARGELLERELGEMTDQCLKLKARLEEAEASLNETGQECAQVKVLHSELQSKVQLLQDEIQRKDASLQATLSEKAGIEQSLDLSRKELGKAKQQLTEMSAQYDQNIEKLHSIQQRIDAKDAEITGLAHQVSISSSNKRLIEEKVKEVDELVVAKAHLEHQLDSFTKTMREKEEESKMQKSTLENELDHIREQLTLSVKEIELMKNERERKEQEQLAVKQKFQKQLQQLQRECSELDQRASVETQLRNSHAEEVATLQTALEKERHNRKKQIHDLQSQHSDEIQQLIAEYSGKLESIKLSHAEDLRHREEEIEAQFAGEMAYLKLHQSDQMNKMKAQHAAEVERIVSENHQLMSTMKCPTKGSLVGEDYASELLLMKITELAPVLAREAREVNELCKITGQSSSPFQSEFDQLQAQLASEQREVAELNRELAKRDADKTQSKEDRDVLQRELRKLRNNNEQLQGELSEAREQLAEMESSMKKATSTVTLLKQELEQSHSREFELQQSVSGGSSSIAQLKDKVKLENLQNQKLSSDLSSVQRRLANMELRLSDSDKAKAALQQSIQQLQSELSDAKEAARKSESALRDTKIELEKLSTSTQQQDGSIRTALQAKEIELTKAMDKLLQEKVAAAKANSELSSVTAELTRALAEAESLRHQLDSSRLSEEKEVEGAKDELEKMLTHCQQLEAEVKDVTNRLKQSEHAHGLSSKEKDNIQQHYDRLRQTLRHLLNKSVLLKNAYKKEVLDTMNVEEMIDQLLRQEEQQRVTQDSLKVDRNHLAQEVKRLQQEVEKWKTLAQNHTFTPSRPNPTIHTQPVQLMQEEIMRLFALYRQAEMHKKALIIQKRYLQCQVDAFFQTQQSALLLMADMGAPVNLDSHLVHSKYPRAYTRFRAVGCVVIATLRFRYVLRRKMHHLRSHINKLQRHSQTHTPHQIKQVSSNSAETVSTSDKNASYAASLSNLRQPSPIGLSTGIQTELSGHPEIVSQHSMSGMISQTIATPISSSLYSYPSLVSASPQYHHEQSRSKPDLNINVQTSSSGFSRPPLATKQLQQHQVSQPPQIHGTKPSKASTSLSGARQGYTSTGTSSTHKQKPPSTKFSTVVSADPPKDPKLTAYIKGLERLKARLSKTST